MIRFRAALYSFKQFVEIMKITRHDGTSLNGFINSYAILVPWIDNCQWWYRRWYSGWKWHESFSLFFACALSFFNKSEICKETCFLRHVYFLTNTLFNNKWSICVLWKRWFFNYTNFICFRIATANKRGATESILKAPNKKLNNDFDKFPLHKRCR